MPNGQDYFKRRDAVERASEAYAACPVDNNNAKFDEFETALNQEGYEIRRIS
jgi:hypothetical protein